MNFPRRIKSKYFPLGKLEISLGEEIKDEFKVLKNGHFRLRRFDPLEESPLEKNGVLKIKYQNEKQIEKHLRKIAGKEYRNLYERLINQPKITITSYSTLR